MLRYLIKNTNPLLNASGKWFLKIKYAFYFSFIPYLDWGKSIFDIEMLGKNLRNHSTKTLVIKT